MRQPKPRRDQSGTPSPRARPLSGRRRSSLAALLLLGALLGGTPWSLVSAQSLTLLGGDVIEGPGAGKTLRALGLRLHVIGDFDAESIHLYSTGGINPFRREATFPLNGRPTAIECFENGHLAVTFEGGEVAVYQVISLLGNYRLVERERRPSGGEVTTSLDIVRGSNLLTLTNFESGTVKSLRYDGVTLEPGTLELIDTTSAGTNPNVVANGGIVDAGLARPEPNRLAAHSAAPQTLVAVANDGSNDLSLFALDKNGTFTTLDQSFPVGGRPRTLSFSPDGRFLFVALAIRTAQQPALQDEIVTYEVGDDGSLSVLGRTFAGRFLTDLEVTPNGLVAVTVNDNTRDEVRAYRRQGGELTLDAWLETPGDSGLPPSFKKVALGRDCGLVESTSILVSEYQAGAVRLLQWTPSDSSPTPCVNLADNRFEVRVDWSVPSENRSGVATGTPITTDTGHFWFFDPANVELVVKVLDARVINGHFWVFYGALSDVEYTITVTDTETGAQRRYFNPAGTQASGGDTTAFADEGGGAAVVTDVDALALSDSPLAALAQRAGGRRGEPSGGRVAAPGKVAAPSFASAACTTTLTSLCLAQSRFEVRVDWSAPGGDSGTGNAVPLSTDTGHFWFFDDANVELIVKVLDARVINGKFWVFYGALSDVEYTITVTDTETGAQKTYSNPAGTLGSGSDTSAF